MLLRYILRGILGRLGLALPALCLLVLAFDLGDQGRRLARGDGGLGWGTVLLASLHHLPLYAVQVMPVALILSCSLCLAGMRQRGELAAMACAGLSPWRVARALLLTGGLCALFSLCLGEGIVPTLERHADTLYQDRRVSPLTGELQAARWLRIGGWYLGQAPGGELLGLEVDSEHRLVRRLKGAALQAGAPGHVAEARLLWSRAVGRPEAQSSLHLWRRLRALRTAGHPRPAETLVLHTKLAYPLVNLVAALLVCVLTLPGVIRRQGSVAARELGLALLLILGLWFLIAGGWLLGRSGWLSPALAVWGPVALAAVAGIIGWKVKGLGV